MVSKSTIRSTCRGGWTGWLCTGKLSLRSSSVVAWGSGRFGWYKTMISDSLKAVTACNRVESITATSPGCSLFQAHLESASLDC
eukprot:2149991-Amphidinium_carterae.1